MAVINILYLVQQGVRDSGDWEAWLLFMQDGVEQTAGQTTLLVVDIEALEHDYKYRLRSELPKIYSQDLINNLFRHPYTKIDFVADELQVTRKTATKYLEELVVNGLLSKHKLGKDNFYLNHGLYVLLQNVSLRNGRLS